MSDLQLPRQQSDRYVDKHTAIKAAKLKLQIDRRLGRDSDPRVVRLAGSGK